MGTGSHRPQWEAAKGREDVFGGIVHAEQQNSHLELKYRASVNESKLLENGSGPASQLHNNNFNPPPTTVQTVSNNYETTTQKWRSESLIYKIPNDQPQDILSSFIK